MIRTTRRGVLVSLADGGQAVPYSRSSSYTFLRGFFGVKSSTSPLYLIVRQEHRRSLYSDAVRLGWAQGDVSSTIISGVC